MFASLCVHRSESCFWKNVLTIRRRFSCAHDPKSTPLAFRTPNPHGPMVRASSCSLLRPTTAFASTPSMHLFCCRRACLTASSKVSKAPSYSSVGFSACGKWAFKSLTAVPSKLISNVATLPAQLRQLMPEVAFTHLLCTRKARPRGRLPADATCHR